VRPPAPPVSHVIVNRPLQDMAHDRPQLQTSAPLPAKMSNSPRVQAWADLQARISNSLRPVVQRQEGLEEDELQMQAAPGTLQRQELEDEELLQGKMEPVQRQEGLEEEEELLQGQGMEMEDEELLQGRFTSSEAPVQRQDAAAPVANHTGMPDHLKAGLEQLSGQDLSGVRVHYNSAKPAQLNALAYTQGKAIEVGPGQEQHLAHEGWHSVQQMQGRVKATRQAQGVSINENVGLEHEADVMGAKALQMRRSEKSAFEFPIHVQRLAQLQAKIDNRPRAMVQTRLQDMMGNGSRQVGQMNGGSTVQMMQPRHLLAPKNQKQYDTWEKRIKEFNAAHGGFAINFEIEWSNAKDIPTFIRMFRVRKAKATAPPSTEKEEANTNFDEYLRKPSSMPSPQSTSGEKKSEKKSGRKDVTADFFTGGAATTQEAVEVSKDATNYLIQAWIQQKPMDAGITYDDMKVKADTVYIFATVRIRDLTVTDYPQINVYKIETHYHPVPTSTNFLHVKRSAGSDTGNVAAPTCWLIPGGIKTLATAVERWNDANSENKSSHAW